MTNDGQLDLSFPALIDHELDGEHIHQRPKDGYINATQMCKAAGKLFTDYHRLNTTKAFLKDLSSVMGIPITEQNQEVTPLAISENACLMHSRISVICWVYRKKDRHSHGPLARLRV